MCLCLLACSSDVVGELVNERLLVLASVVEIVVDELDLQQLWPGSLGALDSWGLIGGIFGAELLRRWLQGPVELGFGEVRTLGTLDDGHPPNFPAHALLGETQGNRQALLYLCHDIV